MYERTRKESHLETVWYEVDMLEYCFNELTGKQGRPGAPDRNLLIEGFLLHYRNLIRFYSGDRHHSNDLSMSNPSAWANRDLLVAEIQGMKCPGQELDREFFDRISTYLQHCTQERATEPNDWPIPQMYDRIAGVNNVFKRSFPRSPLSRQPEWTTSAIGQAESFGTATVIKGH